MKKVLENQDKKGGIYMGNLSKKTDFELDCLFREINFQISANSYVGKATSSDNDQLLKEKREVLAEIQKRRYKSMHQMISSQRDEINITDSPRKGR